MQALDLDLRATEAGIKMIKDFFERHLADQLNLQRVSAPLFVASGRGLNDGLNGVERPISFDLKEAAMTGEIIHSLAKWKRMALGRYGFTPGEGLYTDMNAIRRDEVLDASHSIYVDQWDWEKVILDHERTVEVLRGCVEKIYTSILALEALVSKTYGLEGYLPDEIFFITAQDLENRYPEDTPKARENMICKTYKAVFIIGIGGPLKSGLAHDGRAPDYDDWSLNGDLLLFNPILGEAFELSSMGIRVDGDTLKDQLLSRDQSHLLDLDYHQSILAGRLPYTMGGGIGQSRLCMYFLRKHHIGQVQASLWTEEIHKATRAQGLLLL